MTATGGDTVKSLRSWAFGATASGCSAHAENPSASAGRNVSFVYFILHLRTGLAFDVLLQAAETKTGQASVSPTTAARKGGFGHAVASSRSRSTSFTIAHVSRSQ